MLCMTMNWKEKLTSISSKAWPRQRRKKKRKRPADWRSDMILGFVRGEVGLARADGRGLLLIGSREELEWSCGVGLSSVGLRCRGFCI